METIIIDNYLSAIEKALQWSSHVPDSERLGYKQQLINIRREMKKIRYAMDEQSSAAAFGESQMGKSYLVSALLSEPGKPFKVTDGENSYHFINEINPSSPNSSVEATGVITRFTTQQSKVDVPEGYLRVRLLSVTDIILMLSEAFYNQVDYDPNILLKESEINDKLSAITFAEVYDSNKLISEDEVLDILEFYETSSIKKKVTSVINSNIFKFLLSNISKMSNAQIVGVVKMLWSENSSICRLFDDMIKTYQSLGFNDTVYVKFDAVLRKKGTLLDVARLDEMYSEAEVQGTEYCKTTEVKFSKDSAPVTILKSFLSSLIAELTFVLPYELVQSRGFLKDLDILDFPGARRPEQIKDAKLNEGKNLSTVLRRGKVSYLFNKYSTAKRVNALLFCHNNNQSAESMMGGVLTEWVKNIGDKPLEREAYINNSIVSPLFIIGTWFNKDLDYNDEQMGNLDVLKEKWQRRFNIVLEKEVLHSAADNEHWFNKWTPDSNFKNIYMLRDFKYSKGIYEGWTPEGGVETNLIIHDKYPNYFADLKQSFINDEFVRDHFTNPSHTWEESATCGKDGTSPIIENLTKMAPNVSGARDEKFRSDLMKQVKLLRGKLETYYHPESGEEQLKLAKRKAGQACLQIDTQLGLDPYFFGKLIDKMMIKESNIYSLVHRMLIGAEKKLPMSNVESTIFMNAGLDSSVSRDENIERLCDYLGAYDEDECIDSLRNMGVDMEKLLSQNQMMSNQALDLVKAIETYWHDEFLITNCSDEISTKLPAFPTIVQNLWTLYEMLDIRSKLVESVNKYINTLDKDLTVGIIADYLSMSFNEFISSFGYDFYSPSQKAAIIKKGTEMRMNIDSSILEPQHEGFGVTLLADLYNQKEVLSSNGFRAQDRQFLSRFPQYNSVWRWQSQLRLCYLYASDIPDFDVKANGELKTILDKIK